MFIFMGVVGVALRVTLGSISAVVGSVMRLFSVFRACTLGSVASPTIGQFASLSESKLTAVGERETPQRLDAKRSERLPHAAESHGDRLAVHAPGSVAAQERDDLRDLARLQHAVLRVDGGALAPHLLDADAAPFGLRLRRALGHCR